MNFRLEDCASSPRNALQSRYEGLTTFEWFGHLIESKGETSSKLRNSKTPTGVGVLHLADNSDFLDAG